MTDDLTFSPHSANDMERFARWVERRTLALAEARIALLERHKVTHPIEKRQILDAALASIDSGQAQADAGNSFAGVRLLTYLSLRKRSPDMTLRRAGELIHVVGVRAVQQRLDEVNGLAPAGRAPLDVPAYEPPAPVERPLRPGELAREQSERRKAIFDEMCARRGITPAELMALPIDDAERLFLDVTGLESVDRMKLRNRIIKYAEAAAPQPAVPAETGDANG